MGTFQELHEAATRLGYVFHIGHGGDPLPGEPPKLAWLSIFRNRDHAQNGGPLVRVALRARTLDEAAARASEILRRRGKLPEAA